MSKIITGGTATVSINGVVVSGVTDISIPKMEIITTETLKELGLYDTKVTWEEGPIKVSVTPPPIPKHPSPYDLIMPKMHQILRDLNVQIFTEEDAWFRIRLGTTFGVYFPTKDVIVINNKSDDMTNNPIFITFVLLHELIHWTGHASRLNRYSISAFEHNSINRHWEEIDTHTSREEVAANLGAWRLGAILDLDFKSMSSVLDGFFWHANELTLEELMEADKDANQAVDYIMRRIKHE